MWVIDLFPSSSVMVDVKDPLTALFTVHGDIIAEIVQSLEPHANLIRHSMHCNASRSYIKIQLQNISPGITVPIVIVDDTITQVSNLIECLHHVLQEIANNSRIPNIVVICWGFAYDPRDTSDLDDFYRDEKHFRDVYSQQLSKITDKLYIVVAAGDLKNYWWLPSYCCSPNQVAVGGVAQRKNNQISWTLWSGCAEAPSSYIQTCSRDNEICAPCRVDVNVQSTRRSETTATWGTSWSAPIVAAQLAKLLIDNVPDPLSYLSSHCSIQTRPMYGWDRILRWC